MKNKSIKLILSLLFIAGIPLLAAAQEEGYKFTIDKEVKRTSVKQQIGGTCWCYATISFLESEVLRTQQKELDLSEMFIVRNLLPEKASNYVRLGGTTRVADGGLCHHVTNSMRTYGLLPDEACKHVSTSKLLTELKETLDERVKSREGFTQGFKFEVDAIIDEHLGRLSEIFEYQGKGYTSQTFAAEVVKLNPEDYIELTSYTHHPFYQQFRLEIPDNWDFFSDFYNVPIDDLERIVDNALANGYSISWDGDVSEKGNYDENKGYAIIPVQGTEGEKIPAKEQKVIQSMRQNTFDTFVTTDDHLMHLVGVAHDQNGTKFYLIKNSHGAKKGPYGGYLYMSQSYFRLKTISIMVNRNSLPQDLIRRLKISIRITE